MSMPVNADTFDKMVDEDIRWLEENAPEGHVHRDHIVGCLEMAKKYYREFSLPNLPDEARDC